MRVLDYVYAQAQAKRTKSIELLQKWLNSKDQVGFLYFSVKNEKSGQKFQIFRFFHQFCSI